MEPVTTAQMIALLKDCEKSERESKKAMARRMSLGPGACVSRKGAWTTANANWSIKAEARDRCLERLREAIAAANVHGVSVP